MRQGRGLLVIIAVVLSFSGTLHSANIITDGEKLEKGWIVQKTSGEDFVVLDVKAVINAPTDKVWRLLTNVDGWKRWIRMLACAKGVALEGPFERSEAAREELLGSEDVPVTVSDGGMATAKIFEDYSFPWPIGNDWVVREYTFDATQAASGNYTVSFRPIFRDNQNYRGGFYKLSTYNGDETKTLFEYYYTVKRKEAVPAPLFRMAIGSTSERLVESIRRNVE